MIVSEVEGLLQCPHLVDLVPAFDDFLVGDLDVVGDAVFPAGLVDWLGEVGEDLVEEGEVGGGGGDDAGGEEVDEDALDEDLVGEFDGEVAGDAAGVAGLAGVLVDFEGFHEGALEHLCIKPAILNN